MKDDKGNTVHNKEILYDTANDVFYWVKDSKKGILIRISESPHQFSFKQAQKVGYLKRWIF